MTPWRERTRYTPTWTQASTALADPPVLERSQLHTFGSSQLAFVSWGRAKGDHVFLLIVLAAVIASVVLGRAALSLPVPARLLLGAHVLAAVFRFLAYPSRWLAPAFRTFIAL